MNGYQYTAIIVGVSTIIFFLVLLGYNISHGECKENIGTHINKQECIYVDGQDICSTENNKMSRWMCNIDRAPQERFIVDDSLQQMDNYRRVYDSAISNVFVVRAFDYITESNNGPEYICIKLLDYFK